MSSTQTDFLNNLVSAVRENPLAATLIGCGAFWLLSGNEKFKSAANSATAAASPVIDMGARTVRAAASGFQRAAAPPTAPEMDHEDSLRVGESSRGARSGLSETISEATHKMKDRFDNGVAYARENIGELGNSLPRKENLIEAQSSLAEMLEQQPLAIGVVGLAIGAAIAGAFRTSDLESEWVGELSDDLKTDLSARAEAVSQRLSEASDTLQSQLKDVGGEVVDRLKQAGTQVAAAARQKARSN